MAEQDFFSVGDFVFCKLKGYLPWPARIKEIKEGEGAKKYKVIFYGTFDYAFCYQKQLFPYNDESKLRLITLNKISASLEKGIEQLEEDIRAVQEKEEKTRETIIIDD